MKKALVFSLLLAGLSASAAAQNQTGTSSDAAANKKLAAECGQLFKDTNTLANGSLCYRDNKETAEYFNLLSMVLLFNHPKVDQCRQYPKLEEEFKKQSFYYLEDKELKRLCAESREERDRLRRQVEAYMDSKIKQYAEEEAPHRGIPVDELLRKTVAEETERRAKADAFIRQKDGR